MTRQLCLWAVSLVLYSPVALAGDLNINFLDPSQFLNQKLPQNITDQTIKMFSIYTVHRPYSGATSMADTNSLDILVEGTLVKIGDGLITALNQNGIPAPSIEAPAIPMAKVSIRKAINQRADLGLSGLIIRGQTIIGGDVKIVIHDAEEGPSYALRLGYTYMNVPYAYVHDCSTISPELVMSQKLYFAEPYLGIGGRYMHGRLDISQTVNVPILGPQTVNVEGSGGGTTGYAFTGVYFRIFGAQGLRLGVEGTFDFSGFSTVGAVVGLGF